MLDDLKTIDEGEYEFQQVFDAGADIAAVMGTASYPTVRACRKTARECHREYTIDLLGVDRGEIKAPAIFDDAIFCLHLPGDCGGAGLIGLKSFHFSSLLE
jgi:3-hexulose-6-phosphate synthase